MLVFLWLGREVNVLSKHPVNGTGGVPALWNRWSNITLLDTNQDKKIDNLLPGNVYCRFRPILAGHRMEIPVRKQTQGHAMPMRCPTPEA
jgi:hypothetical protein